MKSYNSDEMKKRKLDFLEELWNKFTESKKAYNAYLVDGKTYCHAKILKVSNLRIRKLLLDNAQLLNDDLQKDAHKLIEHFDAWINKWDILKEKLMR